MEEIVTIKTADERLIYGTLNYHKQKSDSLIVFIHGLAGYRNEHQFFNAAPFFTQKGLATFRFNLYGWRKKQRKLVDCTIKIHGEDVTKVVNYFSKRYRNIYLVGHSLGGPSISLADTSKVKAIVLWDPATPFRKRDKSVFVYHPLLKKYIIYWNIDMLMGKEMIDEWQNLDYERLESNLKAPTKIICAGKGLLYKYWKEHWRHLRVSAAFTIIKNANHTFDEEGAEEELFAETLEWIRKYQ